MNFIKNDLSTDYKSYPLQERRIMKHAHGMEHLCEVQPHQVNTRKLPIVCARK